MTNFLIVTLIASLAGVELYVLAQALHAQLCARNGNQWPPAN